MDMVVCIKQVPETTDIGWDPQTGSLIREGVPGILNPNDKNALEAALDLREKHGGLITALSMGPPQAEEALREALSMGIDRGILLSDSLFAGADTLSTSYTLGLALEKIARFDLILCGKESSDGMTAQVGPQLAELLNLPQLTCAIEITVNRSAVKIKQKLEDGFRILETCLPALITVEREINRPRIPAMDSIIEAYRDKKVQVWAGADIGCHTEHLGLKGSPTRSRKVYRKKVKRGEVTILEGEPDEAAKELIQILKQKGLL
ncbi:MAG: electron transfer flavoprotein subunit beta/FixA family protein [Deltaproteobacteria bacterium]|nr:MAG: electron transfer flavoprotein subunit beta/FixA family protein [Deltaproteobacteria bacterium]